MSKLYAVIYPFYNGANYGDACCSPLMFLAPIAALFSEHVGGYIMTGQIDFFSSHEAAEQGIGLILRKSGGNRDQYPIVELEFNTATKVITGIVSIYEFSHQWPSPKKEIVKGEFTVSSGAIDTLNAEYQNNARKNMLANAPQRLFCEHGHEVPETDINRCLEARKPLKFQ